LKVPAKAGLSAALAPLACAHGRGTPTVGGRDLIRAENEKPGTTDWRLTNVRLETPARYRSPAVEGYCSRTSVRPGETIDIMVSTNPASSFVLDIYRLGYYRGLGGRHMARLGSFRGSVQPDPPVGANRLRECRWEPATSLRIPADWPSGVYLGKLTEEKERLQSYVIFIVRDDRPCDFLFQVSDTTWSAYNRWPDYWSMYDDGKKSHQEFFVGPGVDVSWDRPYGKYRQVIDNPLTTGSGIFLYFEFPLAYWMEKEGFDVSYLSGVDTHADGPGLLRTKCFISIGHDEYYSMEQFNNVKAAVQAGVSATFFSGDTCWGVTPMLPSTSGSAHRIITRADQFGPMDPWAVEKFPELRNFKYETPTEASLIGARNIRPYNGVADWTCTDEKHWAFAGTGMKNGDSIPGLLGFEWNGQPADIPGLRVLAQGPVSFGPDTGIYAATIYPGPKENFVFNAATIWWADGLAAPPGYIRPHVRGRGPKGPDPRVGRLTRNLFERARG
jgi:hypothetical protein